MASKRDMVRALKKARKLIAKKEKWTKGSYHDYSNGAFCAIGALREADGPGEYAAYKALGFAVTSLHPKTAAARSAQDPESVVITFNDRKKTKHEDVLAIFDFAIENADKVVINGSN